MKGQPLPRIALIWQLLSVVFVTLPHIFHLPVWVSFVVVLCVFWRMMVYLGRWSFPSRWIKVGLVVVGGVGVLASYQQGGGIVITVALLVLGFGLKVIELYHRRDAFVVLYVAYLVSSAAFLFSQTLAMALYVLMSIFIVTTGLLCTNLPRDTFLFFPLKRTALMLIPAFPLMLILFIGMPRLEPLWEVGLDKTAAKTGLSDRMSPGDITRLTRSAEVAFRVSFEETVPDQTQLYWRALVLNDFDGKEWSNRDVKLPKLTPISDAQSDQIYRYEMILEATYKNYIPILDYIVDWPDSLLTRSDMTLFSKAKIIRREQYLFTSIVKSRYPVSQSLNLFTRERSLPDGNIEAKRLARRWRDEVISDQAFIEKIKQYYNDNFHYSLTPPALGEESVSDFLFDTKTGFCGHFASATAFLLRAVGIPARIVTGYQGGEWNPYDNYFIVRQYDAHAWVEAWLPEQGWTRLDPTAWVAPNRVERPADETLSKESTFLQESALSTWGIRNNHLVIQIRHRIEALNYGWHRWVLNYHHQQKGLLTQLLGKLSLLKLALFFFLPFCIVISVTLLLILKRNRRRHVNPADRAIVALSKHFASEGLARLKGETITHYCHRLARNKPALAQSLNRVSHLYEKIRYEQIDDKPTLANLLKEIRYCLRCRKSE